MTHGTDMITLAAGTADSLHKSLVQQDASHVMFSARRFVLVSLLHSLKGCSSLSHISCVLHPLINCVVSEPVEGGSISVALRQRV